MDFFQIRERSTKRGDVEIYPDFVIGRPKDLMVRGKTFYAIWDEEAGLWSTDEYAVQRLVDKELYEHKNKRAQTFDGVIVVRSMSSFATKMWIDYKNWLSRVPDANAQLDAKLTFSNTKVKKSDYVSRRLPYPLEVGPCPAYEELIGTLYDPEERAKIEWAIGSIVSGDSKDIQKFLVLYGEAGAGKSTILNIVQKLFEGYYTTFEAKALASSNNAFATEVFKSNPLVAIQHDGDLSKIEDNSKLNSIISHEEMTMNEKYKSQYTSKVNCFLFMATNKPVKITDAKSGIIRRLIDVKPSGRKLPPKVYHETMAKIDFELGAIASHCLEVYQAMGKNYYSGYRPIGMMFKTDAFFNFVESNYDEFKEEDGVALRRAYDMYKQYCDDGALEFKLPMYKFREELKNYFELFEDVARVDGKQVRSYYRGFMSKLFEAAKAPEKVKEDPKNDEVIERRSLLDVMLAECLAQYASSNETPIQKWDEVVTRLSDIDTTKLHYVKPPEKHIVIDFDLKGPDGQKSKDLNLEAAGKWPKTYMEYSKGGAGVHLHYIYDGDVSTLSRVYSDGIEIKVFSGGSSLRRRLSYCNDIPVAHISSGLPLKGAKVINLESVKSERALRKQIKRNLNKEIHPGTKPSIDFIHKILEDAYNSGLVYDVSDMFPEVLAFANNSTNQSEYCIKLVDKMKFMSEEVNAPSENYTGDELVFFDVEVFPNLFLVNWKVAGDGQELVHMINPKSSEIKDLLDFRLVGFNCRRYDNHILYARYLGYSNEELYDLSQRIVSGQNNAMISEAYNLSYTDVYDFASAANKKSLKKFEIELGIHHQELGLPWDQPVPEELWVKVAEYCDNDVIATEAVFNHLKGDWTARQIMAELSGLSVNDTTNQHSTKIIFGNNKKPQNQLVYTDLSEMFPGYTFSYGKSSYRGEDPGEGGYVYAEPGIHWNVALLDVASMHPTSIEQLNLFGPYTKTYSDIKAARLAIKHEDLEGLEKLLDGRLVPFMKRAMAGEFKPSDLSTALKTALNSAYGLTSAKFDNPFRDPRNVDNIVAKRGALFMIDLKHAVQERGFTVAHIKTDSIKIPNATPEIIQFVMDFGKKYGYEFEHEATYDRMCLVNDAVYIARYDNTNKKHPNEWTATGAQFAHPYVFKTLFGKEPISFDDLCETKTVNSSMYLDLNESLLPESYKDAEKELAKLLKKLDRELEFPMMSAEDRETMEARAKELAEVIESSHNYQFVGKAGLFCPILPGYGGGRLLREKGGKYYAVTGTKDHRWLEAETVVLLGKQEFVDKSYHQALVDDAIDTISHFGDFEAFVSDDKSSTTNDNPPWTLPCGGLKYDLCINCPHFSLKSASGGEKGIDVSKDVSCDLGFDLSTQLNKVLPF